MNGNNSTIASEHAHVEFCEIEGAVNKGDCFRRKSLESEGGHTWREYTYRKITPCDACGQVLRGHSRQGVRCRSCKANAHTDCINMVQPALCPSLAPKKGGGIPLLRRQKTQVAADEVPASSEHSEYESNTPREYHDAVSSLPPPFSLPSATRQLSHCRGCFVDERGEPVDFSISLLSLADWIGNLSFFSPPPIPRENVGFPLHAWRVAENC